MKRRGYGIASSGNRSNPRGEADYWLMGAWNGRCDQCYLKCKSTEMYKRWDNAYVCWKCYEIRNPQDFVHGIPDHPNPPWTRPNPPPLFVSGDGTAANPPQAQGAHQLTGSALTGSKLTG